MVRNSNSPSEISGRLFYGENRTLARIICKARRDGQIKQSFGASTGSRAESFRPAQGCRIIEMDSKKEVRSACYQ
jgi:hypothetical protein